MDEDAHALKRPLLPASEEKRDPDLYFSDGNIALCATSERTTDGACDLTSSTTYFRVHKSILSKHSVVFQDMFAMPQPVDAHAEHYDGVALVRLYDDPNDLRALLLSFYEPSFVSDGLAASSFAVAMLGPIRLAGKYQVEALQRQAIAALKKYWPGDIEQYDRLRKDLEHAGHDYECPTCECDSCPPSPFQALDLIKAGGLQSQLSHQLALIYYEIYLFLRHPERDRHRDLQSMEHYPIIFYGHIQLQQKLLESDISATSFYQHCSKAYHCDMRAVRQAYIYNVVADSLDETCFFQRAKETIESARRSSALPSGPHICEACLNRCVGNLVEIRKKIFTQLPTLFNTGSYLPVPKTTT